MSEYKCLKRNLFTKGKLNLIPIRHEDRYSIMEWRNRQMNILRQNKTLTIEQQDEYFLNVVSKLFVQDNPEQILFSIILDNQLIGYGGLVHINWFSKHAEISLLFKANNDSLKYKKHAELFYILIEEVAREIFLNKIYTYGYDFSDYRFEPLYRVGFQLDAFLHEHVCVNEMLVPVRIYSKILSYDLF